MAPVSAAIYIPAIVFNCDFIYFVFVFFLFLFSFFSLLLFSFISVVSFLALYLNLMDLFLCFDIFKQFCYLAKCFVNTCSYMFCLVSRKPSKAGAVYTMYHIL